MNASGADAELERITASNGVTCQIEALVRTSMNGCARCDTKSSISAGKVVNNGAVVRNCFSDLEMPGIRRCLGFDWPVRQSMN